MKRQKPWHSQLIEGAPIKIGQREYVPQVLARSIIRRQVTFGTQASCGRGGVLLWLQPLSVIERRPDGSQQRIVITDETNQAIKMMFLGALTLPVLYIIVAVFMFAWRRTRSTQTKQAD
jgi:hypothetical protein